MKIFKKFYIRLPIIYSLTLPFLFAVKFLCQGNCGGQINYVLGVWFYPIELIFIVLNFSPKLHLLLFSVPDKIFYGIYGILTNLIFWFLAGLLIDKIIHRFRKNND